MRVAIKICGLTSLDEARLALDEGADFLGFVLHPPSPRAIAPERLAELAARLPATARLVAVCVNRSPADVAALFAATPLHAAQLHGDETPADFNPAAFAAGAGRLWRAVWTRAGQITPAPEAWTVERYVVDAAAPGRYGGTGTTADWAAAAGLARRRPVMLAGGLTPDNVAAAIRRVRPLGVDVSSGIEQAPGRKDPARLRAFIRAARAAALESEGEP